MKGSEGIDYVVTECGHCGGTGKCDCRECMASVARREVRDAPYHSFDERMAMLQKQRAATICTVCEGPGRVVFWREEPE